MAKYTKYTNGPLRRYIDSLPARGDSFAQKGAALGEGHVKRQIVSVGAVDTGFMLNSVQHQREAPGEWLVFVAALYAYFVNYGTVFQPARPFFEQALMLLAKDLPALGRAEFKV